MATPVVFDVGGVLLHLDFSGVFFRLSERSPLSSEEIKNHFWPERSAEGESDETLLAKATAGRISLEALVKSIHQEIQFDGTEEELTTIYHSLFPGRYHETIEIMTEVAKTNPVGILSNTNAWSWSEAARLIPELTLAKHIFLSYEVRMVKPDPKLFEYVGSKFESPSLIFIDDSAEIIEKACEVGLDGIHFTSPEALRADLVARDVL